MRASALLLIGTAAIAIASPSFAQTTEEDEAQAANAPQDAQTAGDEIIVTATKRASRVQDVPFSINAQTQEDIQRSNASTIEEISRNVAGLTVQNLGPGQSQVSVRGVSAGQIVRDQPGVKEQVGIYLDESVVSLSLFTPDFDLFDLNRVETLRGPQGTLFGSGSVGGTLRYITNQPNLEGTEGLVEANINTVDEGDIGYHLKGAINVPLGSSAATRLVGYGQRYGGFIDAIGPASGKNINDGSRIGGRVALLFEPAPDVKITPRVVYQQIRADGFNREEHYNFYTSFTSEPEVGKRKQYLKLREKFKDDTLLADLTGSIGFGAVELTSITSYIDRDILVSRDASALTGSVGISPLVGCCGVDPDIANLPSNLRDTTTLKQWTQELRLGSTGAGPLQWVLGAFYTDIKRKYAQRLPTPGYDAFIDAALGAGVSAAVSNGFPLNSPYNADLPYDINQKAAFGEASYDFGQFKLTAGGRYYDFKEKRDFISGGVFSNVDTRIGDKTKSNGFSPRVIATYEPNRNLSVNLQAAKGFRLGGVNDPLNLPLCTDEDEALFGGFQSYDDETLWNYEAGVKHQFAGMTFNAAAFYTRIKDLQVTLDAGSCSSRIVFNVDKAHTKGIEAEFAASPIPGLDLSVAGSLIEAEFDTTLPEPLASTTGIRNGNRLPTVPKFQMAATATYGQRLSHSSEWYVSSSFQHVGSRYTQPADQEPGASVFNFLFYDPNTGAFGNATRDFGSLKLPSFNLFNLSGGVKWDSGLEIVGYVNNLFDKNPKLSLDRERGGRARLGYNVGTPRTIGLTLRQAFLAPRAVAMAPPPPPPLPPAPAATQTCPDGSVILATDMCPPPPPPPPPASGQRG
ncbi:TonB-dependent receptor [Sphingomonas sp.]|uniref:TonB-dependent receptor n=1 Tax=Sphingomonas sp. TaxID=28214 RepID=UPI0025D55ADE|nr:TonB-dependent receptor [Sphingomonas sp.]